MILDKDDVNPDVLRGDALARELCDAGGAARAADIIEGRVR